MNKATVGAIKGVKVNRTQGRDVLNIFILATFAVSQPILDLLGSNPLFFVVRGSDYLEIVALTTVVCFIIPGLAAFAALLSRHLPRIPGFIICFTLLFGCVSLFLLPIMTRLDVLNAQQIVLLNLSASFLVSCLYVYFSLLRSFVLFLLPAVIVFPLVFLFTPAVQDVVAITQDSASRSAAKNPSPIVILIFDSLPVHSIMSEQREIDSIRFPNFARLSETATWYRNATTLNTSTLWVIPSVLTGIERYGSFPLPLHAFYPDNLFSALGAQYEMHVTEYLSKLCPDTYCRAEKRTVSERIALLEGLLRDSYVVYLHAVFPKEFTEDFPAINETWGNFDQENITGTDSAGADLNTSPKATVARFLSSLGGGDKPQLHFLHIPVPHAPWHYLPSGKEYGKGHFDRIHARNPLTKKWEDDPWAVKIAYQRHLMQTAYADHVLGQVTRKLRDAGLYEKTMLLVFSDHGNSYQNNDFHRKATQTNMSDLMGIALFIKYPHQQAAKIDDRNVNITDVLPTIFDQIDLVSDWSMEGASLRSENFPQRTGKTIRNFDEEPFTVREDFYLDSGAIKEKFDLLASGRGINSHFGISALPELNGVLLSDLNTLPVESEILVRGLHEFKEVDPDSGYLPALVSGRAPSLKAGTLLAIALNGKIVTVTKVLASAPGKSLFVAVLPESVFQRGDNSLSIHRVERSGNELLVFSSPLRGLE